MGSLSHTSNPGISPQDLLGTAPNLLPASQHPTRAVKLAPSKSSYQSLPQQQKHFRIPPAHYGLLKLHSISNVHILIPVKLAELLNTLVGTVSGWKGRMFVNGYEEAAGRFHRRGN